MAEQLSQIIDEEVARRFYEDGARRWRMPHKRRVPGSGLDTDSMDFRGVRLAMRVTDTLPHDFDTEGGRLPGDPDRYREHYELGLAAVRRAGLLPLDERFVGGYERLTTAIVSEAIELAQRAQAETV